MLFNSVAFLIFLPLVVVFYYLLPPKRRWILLLPASYVFYGWWKMEFLFLILFSTTADFFIARSIHRIQHTIKRKILLAISLLSNFGLLFIFKYWIMFSPKPDPMQLNIFTVDHPILGTILYGIYYAIPVGISFYTFQTVSYTLDVYWKRTAPETHFGKFALFVSFFPQLVAGPIERFSHLMPQLKAHHKATYEQFANAFRLILFGFFVKIGIADNLSTFVDSVYENVGSYDLVTRWIGVLGFGFQIYADFAGYTLIAQGAALCLGIKLMDNFRTPYLSTSIGEFWQRWHISLSTWFRDYLYIPLGGNRVNWIRWSINIMLVFLFSGLWHGANVTFLVWGGIHGLMYLTSRFSGGVLQKSGRTGKLVAGVITFAVVQLAWVFFRSNSVEQAFQILGSLIESGGTEHLVPGWPILLMFFIFIMSDVVLYNSRFDNWIGKRSMVFRWLCYLSLLWCILAWGGVANHPFIYFQF